MSRDSYLTTRGFLEEVALPEETRTYKPVGHSQVIDLTLNGITKAGFNVEREVYTSAKDGLVATGRYMLGNIGDNEMKVQISWQNSYNKSLPLVWGIGGIVLVCLNGMQALRNISAFRKRHRGEIQTFTPHAIPEYIKGAAEMFAGMQVEREAMKEISLTKRLTAELLGRMVIEQGFIESTQLNIIEREMHNPTHNYNAPGSLWELYQFTTFAIGGIHPSRWMQDHIDAHNFFNSVVEEVHSNRTIFPVDIPLEKVTDELLEAEDVSEIGAYIAGIDPYRKESTSSEGQLSWIDKL